MMRNCLAVVMCIVACGLAPIASAGTIIKLGLGGDPTADVEFNGTSLFTIDDLDAATTGAQDTNIDFGDFLSGETDVLPPTASFTMSGLTPSGPATVLGGVVVIQNFTGGSLSLYNPANVLLLSAALDGSILTGTIGSPATGSHFTTSFGLVTGGTLAPKIKADTLSFSVSFTNVNGKAGFSTSGSAAPKLDPFKADATMNIAADPIPEPASAMLAILGCMFIAVATRRCG
jgi:hypothetical protein